MARRTPFLRRLARTHNAGKAAAPFRRLAEARFDRHDPRGRAWKAAGLMGRIRR